jgi:integrase
MPKIVFQKLNARQVASIAKPGLHADGQRLYLQVTPKGAKSWVFRYGYDNRVWNMGLGPYPHYSLQDARKLAHDASSLLFKGISPLDQKRATRAAVVEATKTKTFEQCAREYITAHQPDWHAREPIYWAQRLEKYAFPHVGKKPVREIRVAEIMKVLEPIWLTRNQTAVKVRSYIERILEWAKVHNYRDGENPAAWKTLTHLLASPGKVSTTVNRVALPWQNVGEFVRRLQSDSAIKCRALEFTILTATRSEETLGAVWGEIDWDNKIWVIPAERMKGVKGKRKEHRVPLSSAMIKLLSSMPKVVNNPYIFPGKSGRLNRTAMQVKVRELDPSIMVHGFRSTFRDWATDHEHQDIIAEMALAHEVGSQVERTYRRSDLLERRRQLMELWGEFVYRAPVVVPLRA